VALTEGVHARTLALLCLVTVAGAVLRFYGLGIQSFWTDEAWSVHSSIDRSFGRVIEASSQDTQPPLFPLVLNVTERVLGHSRDALMRLPSAVFGTLAIPMIFLLGCRLYSPREGMLASLLLSFSWCPVYYSQEVRAYSLHILLTMAVLYLWLVMGAQVRRNGTAPWYVAGSYALSSVALLFTHYSGVYVVFVLALAWLLRFSRTPGRLKSWAVTHALILLAFLPWLDVVRATAQTMRHHPALRPVAMTDFVTYLQFIYDPSPAIVVAVCLLCGYALAAAWREYAAERKAGREPTAGNDFLLLALLVLPFLLACVQGLAFHPRYFLIALPAAYILLARSLARIRLPAPAGLLCGAALAGALLVNLTVGRGYYQRVTKEGFRQAVEYVVGHPRANEMVYAYGRGQVAFEYYFRNAGYRRAVVSELEEKKCFHDIQGMIDEEQPAYVWTLGGSDEEAGDPGALSLVEQKERFGINVRLYRTRYAGRDRQAV
jgi:4-amino-4-deoxy-L-arabinose transferase-like glycosyltransferase